MPDVISTTMLCHRCGDTFERAFRIGRRPRHCAPCAVEDRRKSDRERARRAAAAKRVALRVDITCADCASVFSRPVIPGAVPSRCPVCAEVRRVARMQARSAAASARRHAASVSEYENGGNRSSCFGCGAPLFREFGKRYRNWCGSESCLNLQRRLRYGRTRTPGPAFTITCINCGMPAKSRFKSRRLRCDRCALARIRALARKRHLSNPEWRRECDRRRRHVRRARLSGTPAERFTSRYILARDRWTCGICHKRINPGLIWPHPMSPSIDHVIPVSQGGPHTKANCRAAHLRCNSRRNNRGGNEQLALLG